MEDDKFAFLFGVLLTYLILRANLVGTPWWLVHTLWLPAAAMLSFWPKQSDEPNNRDVEVAIATSIMIIWPFLVAVLTAFQMLVDFIFYFFILPTTKPAKSMC